MRPKNGREFEFTAEFCNSIIGLNAWIRGGSTAVYNGNRFGYIFSALIAKPKLERLSVTNSSIIPIAQLERSDMKRTNSWNKSASALNSSIRTVQGVFKSVQIAVDRFSSWGVFMTTVGVLVAVVGLVIDMESRMSERTFRAWQIVLMFHQSGDGAQAIHDDGEVPIVAGSVLREAMEFLNQGSDGVICGETIRKLFSYLTGTMHRQCLFPVKKKESFNFIDIAGADLTDAILPAANFRSAGLCNADFRNAVLIDANFKRADLNWVNFEAADLEGVNFDNTDLTGASFHKAKNLNEDSLNEACADPGKGPDNLPSGIEWKGKSNCGRGRSKVCD